MPTRNLSLSEPHPSIPVTGSGYYNIGGGRGGAGNYKKYKSSDLTCGPDAFGPASAHKLSRIVSAAQQQRTVMPSGRGGAGNMFKPRAESPEQAMFKFDEEMSRRHQLASTAAPVYRVGRGGAGNTVFDDAVGTSAAAQAAATARSSRLGSTGSAASVSSTSSDNDGSSSRASIGGALGRLSRKLSGRP